MFLLILCSIRFVARQGLPLRGHGGDLDSNFLQILYVQSVSFPELKTCISKKTDKYTSPVIQNECLQIMALCIVRQIADKIGKACVIALWQMNILTLQTRNSLQFALGGLTVIFKITTILLVCLKWIAL